MNMSNMVGVGPFLTIPLILGSMGGPQAMLGWIAGAVLAICDGMVWAELASAVPSSGGTLEYLKVAYRGTRLGRLLPFLFIWQFILSGPLEAASGNIGFAQYFAYLGPTLSEWVEATCGNGPLAQHLTYLVRITTEHGEWVAVAVGALAVVLLYRRIESVGKLMVALWAGVVLTVAVVLVCGVPHFDAGTAFDFPPKAFTFSSGFVLGLGSAMLLVMYNFFGYYSVCYIGDEVQNALANDSSLDPHFRGRGGGGLPGDECRHSQRRALARGGEVEVHCLRVHGEVIRPHRRRALDVAHLLDGLCIRLCSASGLFAHSLRGRAGRVLFLGICPATPAR